MRSSRVRTLGPVLSALAVAEAAVRLLSPRERPPAPARVPASAYFNPGEIERGARFARPQLRLGLARQAVQLGLLWAEVASTRKRSRGDRGVTGDVLAAGRLLVLLSAGSLPLSVVSRRRALAVGLDTQSWRGWASDVAKATAIGGVLSLGAGAGVSALVRRYPRDWWLPAAAGSVAAGGLLGTLAPVLLDPLFNDFQPLPDGPTRTDVLDVAAKAGVRVGEVYSVDASRRTSGANAYVNGLGPTKRVVLYDTLLDRYSPQEVQVVVAHELSHVRHRDVLRALSFSAIVAGPVALAVRGLSGELSGDRRRPPAIPALALASSLVSGPVGLVAARLSRRSSAEPTPSPWSSRPTPTRSSPSSAQSRCRTWPTSGRRDGFDACWPPTLRRWSGSGPRWPSVSWRPAGRSPRSSRSRRRPRIRGGS